MAPSYEHIQVFAYLFYTHDNPKQKDKFSSRCQKCVFVGYLHGMKGWKLYDLEQNVFVYSRDISFNENILPFAHDIEGSNQSEPKILENWV